LTDSIAIIGAGMAGLACATALVAGGRRVTLFDKGRCPSGRMAARTVDADGTAFAFDYGAQYMTARDPAFVAMLEAWAAAGLAARWPAAGADAWVGTPQMDAPLAAMAASLDVRWSTHVTAIARQADGWTLTHGDAATGPFATLVVAIPAEQVAPLLDGVDPALAALARATPSAPCWSVMLGFDRALPAPDRLTGDAILDSGFRNSAKPGRTGGESWTLHAAADWSASHIEAARDTVIAALRDALAARVGELPDPVHAAAHRWRYARSGAAGVGCYRNHAAALLACGDWLLAPRVESAWVSGRAAARAILDRS